MTATLGADLPPGPVRRRRPLLAAVVLMSIASIVCALTPSIG